VTVTNSAGRTFTPDTGGVVGLNYYDGRFLRADDLTLEQAGQREYADLSNQGTAAGVVYGFDLTGQGSGVLGLSCGLARTPSGHVIHLPAAVTATIPDLLGATLAASPPGTPSTGFTPCPTHGPSTGGGGAGVPGLTLYRVGLRSATTLQGTGEVYGVVCSGCGSAADSAYRADGVTLFLQPLTPNLDPWTMPGVTRPETHLRSQLAAAWFAGERAAAGRLSAQSLRSALWHTGAAAQAGDDVVTIGVLGWDGSTITLLDRWTACREAIQTPPAGYWAIQLEQRPDAVFLAQVLQFQDQLAAAPAVSGGSAQILIDRGFVELPAAAYLPVTPSAGDLRDQLAAQFGPGVRLWLCAVRRDQIPHELERARSMDRISLLRGLRDPQVPEHVDILVPDGRISAAPSGLGLAVDFAVGWDVGAALDPAQANPRGTAPGIGAARIDPGATFTARATASMTVPGHTDALKRWLNDPGRTPASFLTAVRDAPAASAPPPAQLRTLVDLAQTAATRARTRTSVATGAVATGNVRVVALSAVFTVDTDPFQLGDQPAGFHLEFDAYQPSSRPFVYSLRMSGSIVRRGDQDGETLVLASGGFGVSSEGPNGAGTGGTFEGRRLWLARTVQDGVTATVRDETTGLILDLNWKGSPLKVTARLRGSKEGTGAAAEALPDAGIGRPGNTHHDAAAAALALLGGIHNDPDWVDDEYRRLFPADDQPAATVQATTDWVLFRRRGRQDSEGDPVVPVPADPVTVQILTVPGPGEARTATDAVLAGDPKNWPDGWQATTVVFEGGSTTMLTATPVWQQRYRTDGNGANAVALAGYAGAAGALGPLVGAGRLKALLSALPRDVTPDPNLPIVPVTPPPALTPAQGTSGSAFLITYAPAAPPVQALAVRAVVATSANKPAIDRVRKPDQSLDSDAAPFSALGEGAPDKLKVADVLAELDVFRSSTKLDTVDVETILWTHSSLSTDDRTTLTELTSTIETALTGRPEVRRLTKGARLELDFAHPGAAPVARLFLLVTAASVMS
jgi:hypothetical protein